MVLTVLESTYKPPEVSKITLETIEKTSKMLKTCFFLGTISYKLSHQCFAFLVRDNYTVAQYELVGFVDRKVVLETFRPRRKFALLYLTRNKKFRVIHILLINVPVSVEFDQIGTLGHFSPLKTTD